MLDVFWGVNGMGPRAECICIVKRLEPLRALSVFPQSRIGATFVTPNPIKCQWRMPLARARYNTFELESI